MLENLSAPSRGVRQQWGGGGCTSAGTKRGFRLWSFLVPDDQVKASFASTCPFILSLFLTKTLARGDGSERRRFVFSGCAVRAAPRPARGEHGVGRCGARHSARFSASARGSASSIRIPAARWLRACQCRPPRVNHARAAAPRPCGARGPGRGPPGLWGQRLHADGGARPGVWQVCAGTHAHTRA